MRQAPAVLLLLLLLLPASATAGERVRVMSFNVRVSVAGDGPNGWDRRRDLLIDTVRRAAPDVIGTQELHAEQGGAIVATLPHYAWFGRDRRGGHADEHMGVFYRRDRLILLAHGDFQLSDTPDVPGSVSWGHPYPRMVTWGRFATRGGARFVLFDTHLPYRPEDEVAREKGVRLILARLPALAGVEPVVLTGDFNTTPASGAYRLLADTLHDARIAVRRPRGPAATFHDFTGIADRRIDWIFTRGVRVRGFATVTTHLGGRYPSDHYPIVAELELDRLTSNRPRTAPPPDLPIRIVCPAPVAEPAKPGEAGCRGDPALGSQRSKKGAGEEHDRRRAGDQDRPAAHDAGRQPPADPGAEPAA